MIGLIVLGLAFLFFIVVAFFAAKSLHVGHVVSLVFLFLFTLVFLFMAATSLRTHAKYRPKYAKAMKDLETQQRRHRELEFGAGASPAGPGTLAGERSLARVEFSTLGKTWGNVRARLGQPGQPIQLDMSRWTNEGCMRVGSEDSDEPIDPVPDEEASGAEDGAEEGEEAALVVAESTHGIVDGQFLYGFKEFPIAKMTAAEKEYYFAGLGEGEEAFPNTDKRGLCRFPVAYLGKFIVEKADANMLAVRPAGELSDGQRQQLGTPISWVLYEKLPTDTHAAFKDADAAKLPNLIPIQRLEGFGMRVPPPAYEAMLNEYARDGKEFTGRVNPLRVNVQVKFIKEYKKVVDLEVNGDLPPADSPFDVQGRAQVSNLMQNGPAEFKVGDTATFDLAMADELVRGGFVERVGNPVYSRQLRDYEFSMDQHQVSIADVSAEYRLVKSQVEALTKSLEGLQTQKDKLSEELRLLEEDALGFEAEKKQLASYLSALQQRLTVLQGEVDSLSSMGGY